MTTRFSNEAQNIMAMTKSLAERFGNNYIGVGHFLLCLNAFNQNGRLQIRIKFNDKRNVIGDIRGKKFEGILGNDFPLTKSMEWGLKSSGFHCWIMGDKVILPEHIYLGIIGIEIKNKQKYQDLLRNANIRLSRFKSLLINIYFNPFFRKIGVLRILR
ncbi:MAG: hypothetical protein HOP30_21115 [Cyclobacteriaceae bacterium]|nr:hypothetical protein [Cyclobacteriaceae bacterium]